MKKNYTWIIFILFSFIHMQSQNKVIKGIVVNIDHKPVEDVLVSIINISDNSIFTAFSDSMGHYQLEGLFADSVYLEASTLFSKKRSLSLKLFPGENRVDTIHLEENLLDEIVITAGAYSVKRETDRLLINLNPNSSLLKNSNMWNVMRIIPSVSVSELDGISMIGKQDVSIFINGRKSRLSLSALKSYLESMPAENIKTIEMIYNPGASFNTGSNTGIINITLRKPDNDGLKGTASLSIWQTHYNKQIGSLNLNYNKKKLSVISSFSGRNLRDWSAFTTKKEFLDIRQQIEETGNKTNSRPIFTGNMDISYSLDKKNKIGAIVGVEYVNFHPNTFNTASYKKTGSNVVDSVISSSLESDNKQLRIINNLNYTFTDDHSTFKFDVDFLTDQTKENYTFETYSLKELRNRYKQYYPQNTKMWSAKAEYNYTKDIHRASIGLDGYMTKSENSNEYFDIIQISKPLFDNNFVYKEKSIAGFLSYNIRWNDKFSNMIGIRLVHTNTNGELRIPEKESSKHSYNKLNPSLSLSYTPSENHSLWYNLSVRDNYYKFTFLNPVKIYQSDNSYNTGNPDLKPSRSFSQDISYSLKSSYTIRFGYTIIENSMSIFSLPEMNSMTESKPINYGKENNISISFNFNRSLINKQLFLNTNFNGSYTNYKSKLSAIGVSTGVFNGRAQLSGTFIPSKFNTWQFRTDLQYDLPYKTMSWTYSNSLRGSLEIAKRLNDFLIAMYGFYSLQYSEGKFSTKNKNTYQVHNYKTTSVLEGEYYGFMLSLTYHFGNNKVKNSAKRSTSSSSIQNRFNDNK